MINVYLVCSDDNGTKANGIIVLLSNKAASLPRDPLQHQLTYKLYY